MKKKIFGALAIVSLMATIALGVAVNSSDQLSFGLPGSYAVQVSTHYVGSDKMRSFSLVNTSGLISEAESGCVSDAAAKASADTIVEGDSGCLSDAVAKATAGTVVEAESGCVSDAAAKATAGTVVEAESGCVSDAVAKATAGTVVEAESGCVSDAAAKALSSMF